MIRAGSAALTLALGLALAACAPPPRGALYRAVVAPPASAPSPPPSGASPAQYYTLSAFRAADRLAAASNALDDGLADRAQGRIGDNYLLVIAQRSARSAGDALTDAGNLPPPPQLRSQADGFFAAAAALATAVDATQRALASPDAARSGLLTATQQRRAAAQALDGAMSALLAASWSAAR